MAVFKKRNFNLLREMVVADFKLRYQNSVLGYLWSLMRPLALFSVLYIVFVRVFKFGANVPHFPVSLLFGIVLWTFFLEASNAGMRSIVDKGDLIRKVSIPKYIIVLAPAASAFVNLLLNLVVVLVFALVNKVTFSALIFLLPIILAELLILSAAVSFLLAALFVRFRDIAYIWEVATQVLFYGIPIVYPMEIVPHRYVKLVLLEPLGQIIQDGRAALISPKAVTALTALPTALKFVPYLLVVIVAVLAAFYFKIRSPYFSEDI